MKAGIPVMGHIGLTPQAINTLGKVRVQGKNRDQARQLLADALAVQEAGAFAVVLELVPEQLAAAITERLRIPTIGIGAGAGCSGQIQVINDTLGYGDWTPKHARKYADLHATILGAVTQYRADVEAGTFPARRRPCAWTTPCSTRSSAAPPRTWPTPRPGCRWRGSRSTATSSRRRQAGRQRSMQVVRTRADLRAALRDPPRPVGLVPTMGWLHAGHVSLVERARAESATVVMSIFVNPRQFGEAADFEQYPRNEASDLAKAEAAGVDIVFAPTVDEVYPPGFDTVVSVGAIAGPLEGAARPGHFDGVATVVAILFALVGAERAYFGLKDYQQVRVIRRMALDLALPTTVVPVRDRARAGRPRDVVTQRPAVARGSRGGGGPPSGAAGRLLGDHAAASGPVTRSGRRCATCSPRSRVAQPDYVSVADADTLAETARIEGEVLLSLAVRIDGVRLIDNERA